jgi:hypothetical protein
MPIHLDLHQYRTSRPCTQAAQLGVFVSARFRHLDGDTQFPGSGDQAPIERDEGPIKAPGNSEMEGVRRSEPRIEAAGKDIGEPSIG